MEIRKKNHNSNYLNTFVQFGSWLIGPVTLDSNQDCFTLTCEWHLSASSVTGAQLFDLSEGATIFSGRLRVKWQL